MNDELLQRILTFLQQEHFTESAKNLEYEMRNKRVKEELKDDHLGTLLEDYQSSVNTTNQYKGNRNSVNQKSIQVICR